MLTLIHVDDVLTHCKTTGRHTVILSKMQKCNFDRIKLSLVEDLQFFLWRVNFATWWRIYNSSHEDSNRLLFLNTHRETSDLTNELPKESDQLVCLILWSQSSWFWRNHRHEDSIPLDSYDLSSRYFIPLSCFIRSRRPIPLLTSSLWFSFLHVLSQWHMFGVYFRGLSTQTSWPWQSRRPIPLLTPTLVLFPLCYV